MGSRTKEAPSPLDKALADKRKLEKQLKETREKLEKVEGDREKHQQFFKREFILQLECLRDKQYIPADAMLKKIASHLNACEKFWLGY